MKLLVSLTAILFSVVSFSQNHKKINLEAFNTFVANEMQVLNAEKTLDTATIKFENWDHTVYNPYKNVKVTYPIQLKFKDSNYHSPISINKVITSRYGWRRGRAHKGIDIDLVTGDSVYAMFDGVVRFARYNSGHGRTVIVRHYNGLETVYAHLSKYAVKENDVVKKGDMLGKGGISGNARGSHLHLVINYKGVAINPEYLLDFNKENTLKAKEIWVTKKWTQPVFHNSKRQSRLTILHTKEEAIASLVKQRKVYIVRQGDTLSRISVKNNVTIASICKTNYIKRNTVIRIGQKLILEI